jgi:hypothetical protein
MIIAQLYLATLFDFTKFDLNISQQQALGITVGSAVLVCVLWNSISIYLVLCLREKSFFVISLRWMMSTTYLS